MNDKVLTLGKLHQLGRKWKYYNEEQMYLFPKFGKQSFTSPGLISLTCNKFCFAKTTIMRIDCELAQFPWIHLNGSLRRTFHDTTLSQNVLYKVVLEYPLPQPHRIVQKGAWRSPICIMVSRMTLGCKNFDPCAKVLATYKSSIKGPFKFAITISQKNRK